jgi:hypothetical protein
MARFRARFFVRFCVMSRAAISAAVSPRMIGGRLLSATMSAAIGGQASATLIGAAGGEDAQLSKLCDRQLASSRRKTAFMCDCLDGSF